MGGLYNINKMEVKLKRSGGIVSIKKEAATKVDWNEKELEDLITAIKRKDEPLSRGRDTTGYFLEVKNEMIPVDLDKIPAKFKAVFKSLKDNLKPIKF
jgi:hypothetical protein